MFNARLKSASIPVPAPAKSAVPPQDIAMTGLFRRFGDPIRWLKGGAAAVADDINGFVPFIEIRGTMSEHLVHP